MDEGPGTAMRVDRGTPYSSDLARGILFKSSSILQSQGVRFPIPFPEFLSSIFILSSSPYLKSPHFRVRQNKPKML